MLIFFIDLVHTFTLKKLSSISGFLDYWSEIINKKSIVISEDVNAVRLMTIHKSKGLAFPIVSYHLTGNHLKKRNVGREFYCSFK